MIVLQSKEKHQIVRSTRSASAYRSLDERWSNTDFVKEVNFMTQNQINYAKVREDQRHNLATESMAGMTLDETRRHNVITEGETGRHNLAAEDLNWYLAPSQEQVNYSQRNYNNARARLTDTQNYFVAGEFGIKEAQLALQQAEYRLDKWVKEHQTDLNAMDVATRRDAQRAAESKIDAEIEDLAARLGLDLEKWKNEKKKVVSEIARNWANFTGSTVDVFSKIYELLMKAGLGNLSSPTF